MNQQDQISIRQASIFDVDLLAPMFDAYRQFYSRPSDFELARQFLFARLRNDQSIVFLAVRQDDSAVGFASYFPASRPHPSPGLLSSTTSMCSRTSGAREMGKLLLTAAAQFGRAAGAVRLTLSTEITNQAAQALYDNAGWTRQTDFQVYNLPL